LKYDDVILFFIKGIVTVELSQNYLYIDKQGNEYKTKEDAEKAVNKK
jgi:hypothetical protein